MAKNRKIFKGFYFYFHEIYHRKNIMPNNVSLKQNSLFPIIDIGTTKIVCLVGEAYPSGGITVLGIGKSWERGLKAGEVTDSDEAARSVAAALRELEGKLEFPIHSALIGITGPNIHSFLKKIWIALGGESRSVNDGDIKKLQETINRIGIPAHETAVQALCRGYLLDDSKNIPNPVGMVGKRLGMETSLITLPSVSMANLKLVLEKSALEIELCSFASQILALSEFMLLEIEKGEGAAVLDLGGEICQAAFYAKGRFQELQTLPWGGNHLSQKLAQFYKLTFPEAEDIKRKFPADPDKIEKEESVSLSSQNTTNFEIASLMKEEVLKISEWMMPLFKQYSPKTLVLTGGGCQLKELPEILGRELQVGVRIGKLPEMELPQEMELSPRFHSALAMLLYAAKSQERKIKNPGKTLFHRFKKWLEEAFL